MDWGAMLVIALWAYQIAYKVTTQYTPFELFYSIQPIMLEKFAVPTKWVHNLPHEDIDKTIKVRIEDLFKLDESHWQAIKNINHIQPLCKEEGWKKKDEKF